MEALVGRDAELATLQQYAQEAARGAGRLVLVSGNTGVGKTSLVTAALAPERIFAVFCAANPLATAPLGPLVDALRKMEREGLLDLRGAASRIAALKHILPELGDASEPADRAGLIAALCDVMAESVHDRPLAVVLDDLQWADHATLELLPMLAERSHDARLLIIGIYSSDAVTGSHPIRALRDSLRRARRLSEIPLSPLDEEGVRALAEKSVGVPVDAPTARRLFAATGGVPFFVEALAHSLLGDHPQASSSKERVRDAIAARFDRLCHDARLAAEAGAALGIEFALRHAASIIGSDSGFEALLRSGLVVELTPGIATFRPGLVRDALYDLIPWSRRRLIHRAAAELLEREGHVHQAAEHWQACGELVRARETFLQAAERSRRLYAHRDAAAALRQALDHWTRGDDEGKRLSALDLFADASLLAGSTADALTAWREIIDSSAVQPSILARAYRKIANVHEMNCEWASGLAARQDAQAAFVAAGEHAEAAIEGLTAALRLRQLARHGPGIEVLVRAAVDAEKSGRKDLQVRVAALRANLEVRLGKVGEGIPVIRAALEAALALDEPVLAGEIYQRLADAIERSGDYEYATKVNLEGISYCEQRKAPPGILACLACMSWILIRSGEWEHAASASRRMAGHFEKNPVGRAVGIGHLGMVHVLRGDVRKAEPLLLEADVLARRLGHALLEGTCLWGLALVADANGDAEGAAERSRAFIARLTRHDERHAVIPVIRWAANCFSIVRDRKSLAACVDLLSEAANMFSHPEPLSALAHSIGEMALVDGEAKRAVEQFEHAIALLEEQQLPRERIESELRASTACEMLGARDAAAAHAREAARRAERLGARILEQRAAAQLRGLGVALSGALGPRAGRRNEQAGLTARQLQILTGISRGLTDKELARSMGLSPRTVESHVAKALAALQCRSRSEAVRKASELGILAGGRREN